MDFAIFIRTLRRSAWLVVLTTVVGLGLGVGAAVLRNRPTAPHREPTYYSATETLGYDPSAAGQTISDGLSDLATVATFVIGQAVTDAVGEQLGVDGTEAATRITTVTLPDSTTVGQTLTISFSQSVTNVTFALFDIDNSVGGWGDRIVCNPAPATVVTTDASWTPTSSTVTGAGTTASPLRNTSTNVNFADTSSLGNVTLTFPGPLSTLTLHYTNAVNTGGGKMRIGIDNISFCG